MSNYYLLKKEIIATNVNDGFDQLILNEGSVIELHNQYVRYKGRVWNDNKFIYYTYRFKSLFKNTWVTGATKVKLKTYEFTIDSRFLNDFIELKSNKKNYLLIELHNKINNSFENLISEKKAN